MKVTNKLRFGIFLLIVFGLLGVGIKQLFFKGKPSDETQKPTTEQTQPTTKKDNGTTNTVKTVPTRPAEVKQPAKVNGDTVQRITVTPPPPAPKKDVVVTTKPEVKPITPTTSPAVKQPKTKVTAPTTKKPPVIKKQVPKPAKDSVKVKKVLDIDFENKSKN